MLDRRSRLISHPIPWAHANDGFAWLYYLTAVCKIEEKKRFSTDTFAMRRSGRKYDVGKTRQKRSESVAV
jgi:hypothetical protein